MMGKVPIGQEVVAIGEIKREGKRILHAHATLVDPVGEVVAEGGRTF